MAHLLIIDLPDGNDTDLVQAAIARGDRYTFLSGDLGVYRRQPAVQALLDRAWACVAVPGLAADGVARRMLAIHATQPFDAVLCGPGTHHADVARLAQRLGCVFLNPVTAALLLSPPQWRQRLQDRGLPQHRDASPRALDFDLSDFGPADDGAGRHRPAEPVGGAHAGRVIACDTLTQSGRHRLLGVHEKWPYPPPSSALRGSTFTPQAAGLRAGPDAVERYLGAVLDALNVDSGAAHTELSITARGLQVVSIRAGLPGGRLPRLLGYALGRSLHADLIALHCGQPLPVGSGATPQVAVLRTLAADREGVLDEVVLPTWQDPAIRCVDILQQPGQAVRPPLCDADSLGCVMVCGPSRADAEDLADRYVARTLVRLRPASEFSMAGPAARGLELTEPASVRTWPQNPTAYPSLQPQTASPPPGC